MLVVAGTRGYRGDVAQCRRGDPQVCRHLESHLSKLPEQDKRSRAILETMQADERRHAANAHDAGATELPQPVKNAMALVSKIMTFAAYRL